MPRMPFCLRLAARVAAFAALPFILSPARAAESRPTAWRFRVNPEATAPQTVIVTHPSQGWFQATDARGKEVVVVFPRRHGWVERGGGLIPTEALRTGDRVEVWGFAQGRSLMTAHARLIARPTDARADRR
jgi:hypothetical protein